MLPQAMLWPLLLGCVMLFSSGSRAGRGGCLASTNSHFFPLHRGITDEFPHPPPSPFWGLMFCLIAAVPAPMKLSELQNNQIKAKKIPPLFSRFVFPCVSRGHSSAPSKKVGEKQEAELCVWRGGPFDRQFSTRIVHKTCTAVGAAL